MVHPLEVSPMKKMSFVFGFLVLLFLTSSSFAGTSRLMCSLENGVTSFFVIGTGNAYNMVSCSDGGSGSSYKVAFKGVGIGASASLVEGIALHYFGFSSDIAGIYYGLRVDAALAVGANAAILGGNNGLLTVVGADLLAVGADVSYIRLVVGENINGVAQGIAEAEGVPLNEVQVQ